MMKFTQNGERQLTDSAPHTILIGLGPFARKHYFGFFKKHSFFPKCIVELESKENFLRRFLHELTIPIPIQLIPDSFRDCNMLPLEVSQKLLKCIKEYKITHAIIATEPKAHFAYLNFFIENGIHVLVEKPLTAIPYCSYSLQAAEKIEEDFEILQEKIKKSPVKDIQVILQCQRRYHPVYQFIQNQIEAFVKEFDIPLTYCDIYHCDGMWNMPNEFLYREDHPYKYGYGKLMHSGYHFIDLLVILLKSSFKNCSKKPDFAELYGTGFSPLDFLSVINQNDYSRFFEQCKFDEIFDDPHTFDFPRFGELDFHSILQLFSGDKTLTTCNINLLQTGFSRRAWTDLPEDSYKSNGRIRHERANLQFGPFLNIQVHSYMSSESKDTNLSRPFEAGQARHFDVMIFRNSKLIGGKPFERFQYDHFTESCNSSFNELSRSRCLRQFLNGESSNSDLREHALSIKFLSKALKALCRRNADQIPIEKFDVNFSNGNDLKSSLKPCCPIEKMTNGSLQGKVSLSNPLRLRKERVPGVRMETTNINLKNRGD